MQNSTPKTHNHSSSSRHHNLHNGATAPSSKLTATPQQNQDQQQQNHQTPASGPASSSAHSTTPSGPVPGGATSPIVSPHLPGATNHTSSNRPPSPFTSSRPSTPLKMFTQTPPSAGRLDEFIHHQPQNDSRAGAGIGSNNSSASSSRRRRSGVSPVSRLPALAAKGSYSYGSTTTIMPNVLRVQDTSNSLKELLAHTTNLGKSRLTNTRNRSVASSGQEDNLADENDVLGSDGEDVDLPTRYSIQRPPRTDWSKATRQPARVLTEAELREQANRRRTLRARVNQARQPPPEDDDDSEDSDGALTTEGRQRRQGEPRVQRPRNTNLPINNQTTQTAPNSRRDSVATNVSTGANRGNAEGATNTANRQRGRSRGSGEGSRQTRRRNESARRRENNSSFFREVSIFGGWNEPPPSATFLAKAANYVGWVIRVTQFVILKVLRSRFLWIFMAVAALAMIIPYSISEVGIRHRNAVGGFVGGVWSSIRIPGLSSNKGSEPSFSAPQGDPKDLEEILQRLRDLEGIMQKFSDSRIAQLVMDSKNRELDREAHASLANLVSQVSGVFSQHTKTLSSQFSAATGYIEGHKKTLEENSKILANHDRALAENANYSKANAQAIDGLRKKSDELAALLEIMQKNKQRYDDLEKKSAKGSLTDAEKAELFNFTKKTDELDRLIKTRSQELATAIGKVTQDIEQSIKPDIKKLQERVGIFEAALQTLEKNLPEQLPIRIDGRGNMKIRPEFYKAMADFIRSEFPNIDQPGGSTPGAGEPVERPLKWEAFLRNNEKALKSFIGQGHQEWWEKATRDQTIVTKEQFMAVLREEIKPIEGNVEKLDKKVTGYKTSVANEINESRRESLRQAKELARLTALMKGGGPGYSPVINPPPSKGWFGKDDGTGRDKGKGKGADVGSGVDGGIGVGDERIDKHTGKSHAGGFVNNHASALADFAGFAGGAYIDPFRTSPTFTNHPANPVFRAIAWVLGTEHMIPRPKVVISSVTREPGNCWPFAGKRGQLGLVLREPIYITDFTLEHIDWQHAIIKTAVPKRIDLWAEVYPRKLYDVAVKASALAMGIPDAAQSNTPQNVPWDGMPGYNMTGYVRIGSFEYEFAPDTRDSQTWAIPLNMRQLGVSSEKVVVRIEDNYGNDVYTCLYRIRVHGEPVGPGPANQGYLGERGG